MQDQKVCSQIKTNGKWVTKETHDLYQEFKTKHTPKEVRLVSTDGMVFNI